jgi:hypothetical protein
VRPSDERIQGGCRENQSSEACKRDPVSQPGPVEEDTG